MSPSFIEKKINPLNDKEGEKGLLKFLVLKKRNYKMMGNSVSGHVSAVKTVKPQKFPLHYVIIFLFGVHKCCCRACHVLMLKSCLCSHLEIISFQNHTHTSYLCFPPHFSFFLFLFCSNPEVVDSPACTLQ